MILKKTSLLNKFLVAFLILISLILIFVPEIDLWVASLFFDQQTQSFKLNYYPLFRFIHLGLKYVVTITVLIFFIIGIYSYLNKQQKITIQMIYLIFTLAIGPGLIVNNLFKEHWGRARPNQILEFNGNSKFSCPWVISNQCSRNCSFVSGHAATGFWMSSFAFIQTNLRRKKAWLISGIIGGSLLGFIRIAMGGHFLSDVYFSGLVVILTSYLISLLLPKNLK